MALVTIVYALDKTGHGPDLDRIGTVEDMPDELARVWVNSGVAREPSEEELAGYNEQKTATQEDLGKKLKPELEAMAADLGVDVPKGAKKDDLVAAIEEHRAQQGAAAVEPGSVSQPTVVTTMPGVSGPTSSQAGSPTAADGSTGTSATP